MAILFRTSLVVVRAVPIYVMVGFPSLGASSAFLSPEHYILKQIDRLTPKHRDSVLASAQGLCMSGRKFRLATLCSGTENPVIWTLAFFRAAKSLVQLILNMPLVIHIILRPTSNTSCPLIANLGVMLYW